MNALGQRGQQTARGVHVQLVAVRHVDDVMLVVAMLVDGAVDAYRQLVVG